MSLRAAPPLQGERRETSTSGWTSHAHDPVFEKSDTDAVGPAELEAAYILLSLRDSPAAPNDVHNTASTVGSTRSAGSNNSHQKGINKNLSPRILQNGLISVRPSLQPASISKSGKFALRNMSNYAHSDGSLDSKASTNNSTNNEQFPRENTDRDRDRDRHHDQDQDQHPASRERRKNKNDQQNLRRARHRAGTFGESEKWDEWNELELKLLKEILQQQIDIRRRATNKDITKLFRDSRPKGSKERTASAISSLVHRHAEH